MWRAGGSAWTPCDCSGPPWSVRYDVLISRGHPPRVHLPCLIPQHDLPHTLPLDRTTLQLHILILYYTIRPGAHPESTLSFNSGDLNTTIMTTNNDQDERYHLRPQPSRISRPFAFFHPTHAVLLPANSTDSKEPSDASHWSSRASRKNRYTAKSAALHHHDGSTPSQQALQKHPSAMVVQQRLRHPHSRLKVHLAWDVSFWVAIAFVLGSAAWVSHSYCLSTLNLRFMVRYAMVTCCTRRYPQRPLQCTRMLPHG